MISIYLFGKFFGKIFCRLNVSAIFLSVDITRYGTDIAKERAIIH